MRSALVLAHHLRALGAPPATSTDWAAKVTGYMTTADGSWGMFANDTIGDCTCADCGHQLMVWTANTGGIVKPTDQDIINLYSAITGYNPNDPNNDQGAAIEDVCAYMKTTGLLGHKLDNYAACDPANIDSVRWAVQLFGTVKIGINLPDSAEDQFEASKPWDVVAGAKIEGGHDVCIVKYVGLSTGQPLWYVVTWGKLQPMTQAFFAKYCDQVDVPLSADWVRQNNTAPSGFDLQALQTDLATVSE